MFDVFLFLKAAGLGIAIAAPIGPIAILCIRRTLIGGIASGLATGMGAATADGLYAALAAFGLTAVIEFLVGASPWIQPIGALCLCYIGIRLLLSKEHQEQPVKPDVSSHFSSFTHTMLLTLANPLTIMTFLGIVAVLEFEASASTAFIITTGVLLGSALWHVVLVSGVSIAKPFLKPVHFKVINYLSGLVLAIFALSMLVPFSWLKGFF